MLKPLGFFEELFPGAPEGVSAGRLLESIPDTPAEDSGKIAAYLKNGHEIFDTMGAERDVVTGGRRILGAASLQTDGVWVWRVDLAHYVRNYGVLLPSDFTDHVRRLDHTVPAVPDARLVELADEVLPCLGFRTDGGGAR
ncbi:hypothetical protein SAMN05216251_118102 [Actinacidiphila alni]|uniref:Uncharacterized protein n=1 Tax=Actinacidiphila alni TaxID=380248 RepID=A0A1I2JJP7_9ACTN|nr:hypothetical protein [Actinacidiphila alni]SFF54814.1 hypothetical protein SAMN05216251_118102 [Actinacidiphila alni]